MRPVMEFSMAVGERFGRRAVIIWHFAVIWIIYGSVIFVDDGAGINLDDGILFEQWPLGVRCGLWWATGVIAIVASLRVRWQDYAWWALLIMPAERVIGFAFSLGHFFVPGPPPGRFGVALALILVWSVIFSLIRVAAGVDEDTLLDEV